MEIDSSNSIVISLPLSFVCANAIGLESNPKTSTEITKIFKEYFIIKKDQREYIVIAKDYYVQLLEACIVFRLVELHCLATD